MNNTQTEGQLIAINPMDFDEATRKKYFIVANPEDFSFTPSDNSELLEGESEGFYIQTNPFTKEEQLTRYKIKAN